MNRESGEHSVVSVAPTNVISSQYWQKFGAGFESL